MSTRELTPVGTNNTTQAPAPMPQPKRMNLFERYLSLWVALCMAAGGPAGLGHSRHY